MSEISNENVYPSKGGSLEDPISLDSSDGEQAPFPIASGSGLTPGASTVTLAGDSPSIKEEEDFAANDSQPIDDESNPAEQQYADEPVIEEPNAAEEAIVDKEKDVRDEETATKEPEGLLNSHTIEEPLVAEGEKPEDLEKDIIPDETSANDTSKSKPEVSPADAKKVEKTTQPPKQDEPSQPIDSNTPRLAETITASKTDKPNIYLITSFTSPMRHMISATNRLELILTENNISFQVVDAATNEKAKKVWRRYSKGKALPGVLRDLDVVGNYQDIDDANEAGEVVQLVYDE